MRQKISITVETEIVDKIDKNRGDITRSTYIQRLLERALKMSKHP